MDSDSDDSWSDSSSDSPSQTRIATTRNKTTTTPPEIPAGQDLLTSRFSPEVMGVIFEFYLEPWTYCWLSMEDVEEQDEEPLTRLVLGPLLLGAVCQTWRRIAWAHLPLWSRVHIDLASGLLLDTGADSGANSDYDTFFPPNSRRWDILEQWVSRAGQLPLSVHISHPNIPEDQSSTATLEVLRVFLSRNSERLSYLEMYGPTWFLFHMDELFTRFPKLNTLVVKCAEEPDSSWPEASREPRRKDSRPWARPTDVTILGIPLLSLAFIWTRVTHLAADSYNCRNPMHLLSLAKNLRHCSFKVDQPARGIDYVEPNCGLDTSIQSFEFWQQHPAPKRQPTDPEESLDSKIFGLFTFPQLTSLRFGKHVRVPLKSLSSFIVGSKCSLTSLSIADTGLDGVELLELLHVCASLTELELPLCNESYEDKFLKVLSKTTSPSTHPGNFRPRIRTSHLTPREAIVHDLMTSFAETGFLSGATAFLPNLQTIKFKRGRLLPSKHSFWKRLPTIFGPATTDQNSSDPRRPLKFVHIDFGPFEGPQLEPNVETIRTLQQLESEGIEVSLSRYGVVMDFAQLLEERKKVSGRMKEKRAQISARYADAEDSD